MPSAMPSTLPTTVPSAVPSAMLPTTTVIHHHRLAAVVEDAEEAGAVAAVEVDAGDASAPQVFTYTFRTCPRAEWRPIIEKNILSEPATSAAAIQEALSKEFGRKFLVSCKIYGGNTFVQLAPEGDAYCAVVKEGIRCGVEQPNA